MGISFSQYILNLKIDKAKNLLRFSEYSIGEITYYLGFQMRAILFRHFKNGLERRRTAIVGGVSARSGN